MNEVLLAIEIPRTFEVGCVIGFFAGMPFICLAISFIKSIINCEVGEMKKTWKNLTPIPPEYNGHGYEFYCTKCGYGTAYLGKEKYPPYECPNCGKEDKE